MCGVSLCVCVCVCDRPRRQTQTFSHGTRISNPPVLSGGGGVFSGPYRAPAPGCVCVRPAALPFGSNLFDTRKLIPAAPRDAAPWQSGVAICWGRLLDEQLVGSHFVRGGFGCGGIFWFQGAERTNAGYYTHSAKAFSPPPLPPFPFPFPEWILQRFLRESPSPRVDVWTFQCAGNTFVIDSILWFLPRFFLTFVRKAWSDPVSGRATPLVNNVRPSEDVRSTGSSPHTHGRWVSICTFRTAPRWSRPPSVCVRLASVQSTASRRGNSLHIGSINSAARRVNSNTGNVNVYTIWLNHSGSFSFIILLFNTSSSR